MDWTIILYILISLAFSAFFSGMEIAFVSSSKLRYELDKHDKSFTSKILDIFYNNPNDYISTMLVGNNIALVVYGLQMAALLEPIIARVIDNSIVIVLVQSIISTILILFAGEFIPKTIFKINPNFSLSLFALPLLLLFIILFPISKFASFISFLILKVLGVNMDNDPSQHPLGKVDLDFFIQQSIEDSPQDSEMDTEVKMFQNALEFSNVRLRDCCIPRTELVACDKNVTLEELQSKFVETGLSKILIFNDNIDNIIGYIHSSEMFKHPEDWRKYLQTVPIVPETMAANKLMKLLMQTKKSMAVVVDEFGGTSGIVTLEDLVEEIFGEIEDEHDTQRLVAKQVNENEYLLSGRIEIDTINEKFGLEIPESDDYVTIAGFILHHYQKLPIVNETIIIERFSFKIMKVTTTKIELVRMKVLEN